MALLVISMITVSIVMLVVVFLKSCEIKIKLIEKKRKRKSNNTEGK